MFKINVGAVVQRVGFSRVFQDYNKTKDLSSTKCHKVEKDT